MRLETSQDLLERVRARLDGASYYRVARVLEVSEGTIANWRHGRTGIGREYVTRVAELLEESPEYVLACVECEREQDATARKLWRSIAAKFRAHAASILLAAIGGALLSAPQKTSAGELAAATDDSPSLYIMSNRTRRRSKLQSGLKKNNRSELSWRRISLFTACQLRPWHVSPART